MFFSFPPVGPVHCEGSVAGASVKAAVVGRSVPPTLVPQRTGHKELQATAHGSTCEHREVREKKKRLLRCDKDTMCLQPATKLQVASNKSELLFYRLPPAPSLALTLRLHLHCRPLIINHLSAQGPQLINQLKNPHKATTV